MATIINSYYYLVITKNNTAMDKLVIVNGVVMTWADYIELIS